MDISLLALLDFVLPCIAGVVGIALYLVSRPVGHLTAWVLTVTIALVAAAAAAAILRSMLPDLVPTVSLLKAYGALALIPAGFVTAAALFLRSRFRSRILGTIVLIIVLLGAAAVARRVSGLFFDLVDASG